MILDKIVKPILTSLVIGLFALAPAKGVAQQVGPSLEETTTWLTQAFVDYGPVTEARGSVLGASIPTVAITGCQVTLAIKRSNDGQAYLTQTDQFSFGSLDPESITTSPHPSSSPGMIDSWTSINVHSTASPQITETYTDGDGSKSTTVSSVQWVMHIEDPFTPRFVSALKHAIQLCGGKKAAF
jgi:hypothetical protein